MCVVTAIKVFQLGVQPSNYGPIMVYKHRAMWCEANRGVFCILSMCAAKVCSVKFSHGGKLVPLNLTYLCQSQIISAHVRRKTCQWIFETKIKNQRKELWTVPSAQSTHPERSNRIQSTMTPDNNIMHAIADWSARMRLCSALQESDFQGSNSKTHSVWFSNAETAYFLCIFTFVVAGTKTGTAMAISLHFHDVNVEFEKPTPTVYFLFAWITTTRLLPTWLVKLIAIDNRLNLALVSKQILQNKTTYHIFFCFGRRNESSGLCRGEDREQRRSMLCPSDQKQLDDGWPESGEVILKEKKFQRYQERERGEKKKTRQRQKR